VKIATDVTAEVVANRMLKEAVEQARQVTSAARDGDLTQRIPLEGKTGPIGELCAGVNTLMETTSVIFDDVGRVFGALAAGDLSQRISRDYDGTFGKVKEDANATSERLAGIIAICFENVVNHERLKHLSLSDPLTGVHNRRYFDQRLREEADRARRSRRPLSCLFVDVDRFKSINDRFGHPAGDEVLRGVAARIKAELRLSDALGRYGGEEFAAVLVDGDAGMAMAVGERVRAAVAGSPFPDGAGGHIPVTVSLGIASAMPDRFDSAARLAAHLVAAADRGVYRAKAAGRNCVRAED
jgi:diguanylate cyclase (GGDEF)-like protein